MDRATSASVETHEKVEHGGETADTADTTNHSVSIEQQEPEAEEHSMCINHQEPEAEVVCQQTDDDGVPYDTGWAWAVVCGCFINYLLLSGYMKGLDIFYVELLQQFHATAAETGLVFSIKHGVSSLSSPFVMSLVVGRLGKRRTALIGAVLIPLSMILSSLANELLLIVCLMGSLSGLGQALLTSPGEVLMGSYFKKRRFLAMILAKCGASVGSMALPGLVTYFLVEYGFRDALLLTGGLCLNCVPATMLFRPTSYFTKQTKKKRCGTGSVNEQDSNFREVEVRKALIGNDLTSEDADTRTKLLLQKPNFTTETKQCAHTGNAGIPVFEIENEGTKSSLKYKNVSVDGDGVKRSAHFYSENDVTSCQQHTRLTSSIFKKCDSANIVIDKQELDDVPAVMKEAVSTPEMNTAALFRKSNSNVHNFFNGKQVFQVDFNNGAKHSDLDEFQCKPDFVDSGVAAEEDCLSVSTRTRTRPKCPFSMDFSIFGSPLFRLLLAYSVLFGSLNIMTSYLPALANDNDITESQVALLLSIIGGLDFVSRLSNAFIANAKVVRVSLLTATAFFILGVTSQFVRYMTSFNHFLVFSVLLGLLGGVGNLMTAVLVLDFVGLDRMGEALGFFKLVVGASTAGYYPLLGFIRDITGSYLIVYHVVGGAAILAAVLLCCEKCVRRLEHGKGNVEAK